MRSRNLFGSQEEDADVNLTPMLDVVFIMLIFFIVTTSFVRESGIEIQRPLAESGQQQSAVGVLIGIDAQGQVWLDRQPIAIAQLRLAMERVQVEQPDTAVVVQADSRAATGTLIAVMDQVRLAGITKVAVATQGAGSQP
ncbi:ExbD/TolR family protein [Balneatrix alpica]|uniref:ExbD/TolR family protein n=1 Tax=Balneatrix alpica TaxID=75684 RepID=A0ABV5ZF08_9GAMM|nr:biopolymer transporter ExbD [Balneatrix alpica]